MLHADPRRTLESHVEAVNMDDVVQPHALHSVVHGFTETIHQLHACGNQIYFQEIVKKQSQRGINVGDEIDGCARILQENAVTWHRAQRHMTGNICSII